jgi:hypothetical protein
MRFLAYTLLLFFATPAYCQQSESSTKVNVFLGVGYPETYHGGIRLDQKQWHFDASGGTTFQEKEFTVSGNAAYHFGSKKTDEGFAQKSWYTSLGVSYMQWTKMGNNYLPTGTVEEIQAISKDIYVNGRVGRDFNLNSWFNLSLSLGLGVIVYEDVHYFFGEPGMWSGLRIPITPSGQLSLQLDLSNLRKKRSN